MTTEVETLVRRSKREIAEKFTEIVAYELHYFDRVDEIDLNTSKASDIAEMTNGAIDRYRNDSIFHAKVTSIVAHLMQSLDA